MPAIPCQIIQRLFPHFDGRGFDGRAPHEDREAVSRAAWEDHLDHCRACQDALYASRVRAWGVNVADYPCVHMAYRANQICAMHEERSECPDLFIAHDKARDTYMLIKDHGRLAIAFCPWCGVRLPPAHD